MVGAAQAKRSPGAHPSAGRGKFDATAQLYLRGNDERYGRLRAERDCS